jgi:hypothetical protein
MNNVEATILSGDGRFKVEIERRSSGALQLVAYKWTEEWVEGYGKIGEFWAPIRQGVTLTDTLERAEQLAREKLRSLE